MKEKDRERKSEFSLFSSLFYYYTIHTIVEQLSGGEERLSLSLLSLHYFFLSLKVFFFSSLFLLFLVCLSTRERRRVFREKENESRRLNRTWESKPQIWKNDVTRGMCYHPSVVVVRVRTINSITIFKIHTHEFFSTYFFISNSKYYLLPSPPASCACTQRRDCCTLQYGNGYQ